MATNDELTAYIRERLLALDPSMDVTEGSPAMTQVVNPIVRRVGDDPLSMSVGDFLRARVSQEYPSLASEEGSAVSDMLINPSRPLVSAYGRVLQQMKLDQNFVNLDLMTDAGVDGLLSNFFLERRGGGYSVGTGRVYFSSPTFVSFTSVVRFGTGTGLEFFPTTPQTVTADQMALNRQGSMYYVDVLLRAEEPGSEYDIDIGELTTVYGIDGVVRVTNLFKFEGGIHRETNEEVVVRADRALVERSLTCNRGIFTRLMDLYTDSLRNVVVVGMGDPEMQRDILVGEGEGRLVSSGHSLVIGNFALHFGMFEDRGFDGADRIEEGMTLDLNFWPLLYGLPSHQQHEEFLIEGIVADSRDLIPALPSVLFMQISGHPTPTGTVLGGIPMVLPGVFSSIKAPGKIRVSDIPGGIVLPTENSIIEVDDNEVHLGGKHDVWVRPSGDTVRTLTVDQLQDEVPLVAGRSLRTYADSNIVTFSDATLHLLDQGVLVGMLLVVINGADEGIYTILDVTPDQLVLDANLSADAQLLVFKIVDEVQHDLVSPKKQKIPFGTEALGNDLQTTIGSATVSLGTNIITYGAVEGDTFEILEGANQGTYTIESFALSGGGTTPTLDRALGASESGVDYKVYEPQEAVQLPLVRIRPEGVRVLDSSDQTTDITIPPALPVDARNRDGFSGASQICDGKWGFVLPDPGPLFTPDDGTACSVLDYIDQQFVDAADAQLLPDQDEILDLLDDVMSHGCYTDECLPCDGWIACVRLTSHKLHVAFSPTPGFVAYIDQIITWINDVWNAFFLHPLFETITVDSEGFSFAYGTPSGDETPLWQTEICIPEEFFDCCCNVWIGLPEFDIDRVAATISDALGEDGIAALDNLSDPEILKTILGAILGADDPCALQAQPGDVLNITEGPNEGGYIIREVHKYAAKVPLAGSPPALGDPMTAAEVNAVLSWADAIPMLNLAVVIIEGEFPVETCGALCDFFADGWPDEFILPDPPLFDGVCYDDYYLEKSPFDWIIKFFEWLVEFLKALGLDIPDDITMDWEAFIKAFFELLFPSYTVGSPTCHSTLRVYWAEPTTAEFDGGGECFVVEGTDSEHESYTTTIRAGTPSMFSTTIGATELLYAASMDVDPYMLVPSKETVEDIDKLEWPRYLDVTPSAGGGADCAFLDLSKPAPISLGLQDYRDVLRVHEERFLLTDKGQRPALQTTAGSDIVSLLPSFPHDIITDNLMNIGDLLFIEEGADADGYVVTGLIDEKTFTLDRPMSESTPTVLKHGAQGAYDGSHAVPANRAFFGDLSGNVFDTNDIGRYLTVYGTDGQTDDKSVRIADIDVAGLGAYVEVEDDFTGTSIIGKWCITAAPVTDPASTDAGGTELVGLRPFRLYNGTATDWRITDVSTSLDVSVATFSVENLDTPALSPVDGESQPFSILRPGIQRITSTQMEQNVENGLYYFDVRVVSLGSADVYNIERLTKLEPVFGTYRSDGYRYEVENTNFTFSSFEQVQLVFTPKVLPVGRDDAQANFIPTRGQKLAITYEQAPLVDQIQQLLTSNLERQLVSDPLARHFLPQYMYLTVNYYGGSAASVVAADIIAKIDAMAAIDELSVAALEKLLERNGATDWAHPIELITLTHDLDRRVSANRSEDRLGGSALVLYNGTNRISYFIPGPDESAKEEEDLRPGERTRLVRVSEITTLT